MAELALLQAVRLKGRAQPAAVATAVGRTEAEVEKALGALVANGRAELTGTGYKLTDAGRSALASGLAGERAAVDQSALATLYEEFSRHNDAFKALVTRWQLKSETEINDHTDAAYDARVIEDLRVLHDEFLPLVERAATLIPRLGTYPPRFVRAISSVGAGQHEYIARPLIDSYHTVWFELHEELIEAAGLSRADEATAGRAD